jgi:hypothetical protein
MDARMRPMTEIVVSLRENANRYNGATPATEAMPEPACLDPNIAMFEACGS